jgi:hypothetical protein
MLLVQQYLENHTFGDLVRDHGVYASFSKSGHKFSLNYDQIEAKESDLLAQECRGLILAREDGSSFLSQFVAVPGHKPSHDHLSPGRTKILAFPMKRFFNYGQGVAAAIDWSDPKLEVFEKMDGTLCIVYWDEFIEKWCVATRSVPEADLPMDNNLFTFRTLFEKALQETTGYDFNLGFPHLLHKGQTYCFELTTPYNRIVVYYPKSGITLLTVRNNFTYQELAFDHPVIEALMPRVPVVRSHSLDTVEKTLEWVASVNPMEHEGVVVKQAGNRIKVKSPAYVAYNRVRDTLGASERNIVEIILSEKDDDVIPMLPEEIVKNLQKIKAGLQSVIHQHDEWYRKVRVFMEMSNLSDKKSFALAVNELNTLHPGKVWTAPFFQMFDNKSSNMKDFIAKSRKEGSWGDSFLDRMLELAKNHG